MASLIYNSFPDDVARNNINCAVDTFKCMLVTSTYTENKDTHTKRSDITNEITGTGYTAGGTAATVTVTKDTVNDRIDITLGAVSWPAATITARKAVYYKSRGGVATADEIVAVIDFGADITSTNDTWSLSQSIVRWQN